MAVIKGKDLMIFAALDSSAAVKSIAYATNHTLDVQAQMEETSSKDSGKWSANERGKLSWTATSDNLVGGIGVDSPFQKLYAKMIAGEPVKIQSTLAENADSDTGAPAGGWLPKTDEGLVGEALINSITLNAPHDGNASMTIGLTGVGPLLPPSVEP